MTISKAYHSAIDFLKNKGIESPEFDARELILKVFDIDRNRFILSFQDETDDIKLSKYKKFIKDRSDGVPLQYLLGVWDFMGYEFFVGNGVLIPREDTQAAVELALSFLTHDKANRKIADLCAGSGIISVILAKRCPLSQIYAFEKSEDAYKYLEKNIASHGLQNITVVNEDIFESCKNFSNGYFDLIVSNPPYISQSDMNSLQAEVKREPYIALFGGKDGLDFYRGISRCWYHALKENGKAVLEIGINQKDDVVRIFQKSGYKFLTAKKDTNNIDRALAFEKI